MSQITVHQLKELRQRTAAGMLDCRQALEHAEGDMEKAVEILRRQAAAEAAKRAARLTGEGQVGSYIHHDAKIGALVEINCETDFVARTEDFQQLGKSLAEHIAAAAPLAIDKDQVPQEKVDSERRIFVEQVKAEGKPDHMIDKIVEGKVQAFYKDVALMHQAWVRDPKKTIGDLVKEVSAKTGENVQVRRFVRYQLGEA